MTPSDSKAMNDSMRVDIPPCGIGAQAAYVRGFAAGLAHVRELAATQIKERADRLTEERDSAEKCCSMLSRINNGIILAMQSAWIAHKYGNEPADSVMEWIANSLDGPGLLPDPGDDGFTIDAQAWFDAQIAERPDDGIVRAAKTCPNCDTDLPDGCGGLFENDHDCMWRKP